MQHTRTDGANCFRCFDSIFSNQLRSSVPTERDEMTSSVAAVHSSVGKYWYLFVIVFACLLVLYCVAFVLEYLKKDDRILQVVRPWRVMSKMIILQVCESLSVSL